MISSRAPGRRVFATGAICRARRLPSLPPNGLNVKSSCLKGRPSGVGSMERQVRHHEGRVGWLQSRPLPISASRERHREKHALLCTEVVGCTHLSTMPRGDMGFLDAAGTCLILVKGDPPINAVLDDHGGVRHSFAIAHDEYKAALDDLRAHGVEITFEEDRQGGVLTAPVPIFTILTARCWSSSTSRATPAIDCERWPSPPVNCHRRVADRYRHI
jgi:hypothetical protein